MILITVTRHDILYICTHTTLIHRDICMRRSRQSHVRVTSISAKGASFQVFHNCDSVRTTPDERRACNDGPLIPKFSRFWKYQLSDKILKRYYVGGARWGVFLDHVQLSLPFASGYRLWELPPSMFQCCRAGSAATGFQHERHESHEMFHEAWGNWMEDNRRASQHAWQQFSDSKENSHHPGMP